MQHTNISSDFTAIIKANKRLLFKIANTYCQNPADREDLAQEMIFQLWKSWSSFNGSVKLSTWMYRVALNVAISSHRRKHHHTILLDDQVFEIADEELNDGLEENLILLQAYINALKPLDKALMLLYLEERSHREIADIIGISSTNVATKIGRIKQQLRKNFENK